MVLCDVSKHARGNTTLALPRQIVGCNFRYLLVYQRHLVGCEQIGKLSPLLSSFPSNQLDPCGKEVNVVETVHVIRVGGRDGRSHRQRDQKQQKSKTAAYQVGPILEAQNRTSKKSVRTLSPPRKPGGRKIRAKSVRKSVRKSV